LRLSFGHYKSTTTGSNELKVEVSADGSNWTELTYSRATGSGTANWRLIQPEGAIPATANLRIRFRQTSGTTQFRVDDVQVFGAPMAAQTITFDAPANRTYGEAAFQLSASASSGLAVGFTSSNPGVATIDGSTVTIVGAGSTTITATQAGNSDFLAATPIERTLTIDPKALTISGATATSRAYDGIPAHIPVGACDDRTGCSSKSCIDSNLSDHRICSEP
jgi:hypothetical protein